MPCEQCQYVPEEWEAPIDYCDGCSHKLCQDCRDQHAQVSDCDIDWKARMVADSRRFRDTNCELCDTAIYSRSSQTLAEAGFPQGITRGRRFCKPSGRLCDVCEEEVSIMVDGAFKAAVRPEPRVTGF